MMVGAMTQDVAIVDDDEAVLESFRFLLETAGFTVATYASALAFLESPLLPPRCLVVDQNMPLMTGLELAATLRAHGSTTPFLLVTSLASHMIARRASEVGIADVLDKPPSEEALLSFVRAAAR